MSLHPTFAALTSLALLCGVDGAVRPSAAAEQMIVRIGAVVDQTGGSTSPLYRAAVELAAKQMNAALDRNGSQVKLELILGDSKSNPPFAQTEALRLINEEQVKALVTDNSGVTVAVNKLNYDPASPARAGRTSAARPWVGFWAASGAAGCMSPISGSTRPCAAGAGQPGSWTRPKPMPASGAAIRPISTPTPSRRGRSTNGGVTRCSEPSTTTPRVTRSSSSGRNCRTTSRLIWRP